MKLSEAIRLGAMLKPQGFGSLSSGGGTCAFGAALDAIGKLSGSHDLPVEWTTAVWKWRCPACHDSQRDVDRYKFNTLAHLNDTHRWTREQIADWVETIEQQQEQPVPVEAIKQEA